jgi:hypothetical protein
MGREQGLNHDIDGGVMVNVARKLHLIEYRFRRRDSLSLLFLEFALLF